MTLLNVRHFLLFVGLALGVSACHQTGLGRAVNYPAPASSTPSASSPSTPAPATRTETVPAIPPKLTPR